MTGLRRLTCRDPKKDTLQQLRKEIDQLLREREKLLNDRLLMRNAYRALYEHNEQFGQSIHHVTNLALTAPFPVDPMNVAETEIPIFGDVEVPF